VNKESKHSRMKAVEEEQIRVGTDLKTTREHAAAHHGSGNQGSPDHKDALHAA
jgi:hypothetical protein